jgi:hypothetical protein
MNKEHLRFHLQEALEELSRTVAQCENNSEFSEGELLIGMQHLYHHLNTAWNARNLGQERVEQAADADFNAWGSFPKDLPLMEVESDV